MDIYTIVSKFKTERDFENYLISIRWPNKPHCTRCQSVEVYKRSYEKGFKCRSCNSSFSVTCGTIFHSSKIPLSKWFYAISQILAAKKGISSLQLARSINVNRNTAWYLQHRIRKAMKEDLILKGIVEIDETYVGGSTTNMKQSYKKKRNPFKSGMVHKSPVLGMISRENKQVKLQVLSHADGKNIKPIVRATIESASKIVTDGFGGYFGLKEDFKTHVVLNHQKRILKKGEFHLSTIEGFFTMVKRAVFGQYHHISREHLQSYLDEIAFKSNYGNINSFDLLLRLGCARC